MVAYVVADMVADLVTDMVTDMVADVVADNAPVTMYKHKSLSTVGLQVIQILKT